jgi:hypothetical protein
VRFSRSRRENANPQPANPNPGAASSGLARRELEHLVLLQQGVHSLSEEILFRAALSSRELVQEINMYVVQVQSHLRS